MKNKILFIIIALAIGGFLIFNLSGVNPKTDISKFEGKLEKVDTGCFADGECFAVVDNKHITILLGWTNDIVGQVISPENNIGDLEKYIGKTVEVYAKKSDKGYTLYGNSEYYIKVK